MAGEGEDAEELDLTPEETEEPEPGSEIGARRHYLVTIAVDVVVVILTAAFLRFESWALRELGMSRSAPVVMIDFILEWGAILNAARIVIQDQVRAWRRS